MLPIFKFPLNMLWDISDESGLIPASLRKVISKSQNCQWGICNSWKKYQLPQLEVFGALYNLLALPGLYISEKSLVQDELSPFNCM